MFLENVVYFPLQQTFQAIFQGWGGFVGIYTHAVGHIYTLLSAFLLHNFTDLLNVGLILFVTEFHILYILTI